MKYCLAFLFTFALYGAEYSTYTRCSDPRTGEQVRVVNDSRLDNIGYAQMGPRGYAVIVWNPTFANALHPLLASFFAHHECAHIQLFHSLRVNKPYWTQSKEQEADCDAVGAMIDKGILSGYDDYQFEILKRELSKLQPHSTHTHYAGYIRAYNLTNYCPFN
ncbi:hypothetical protein [Bacteriovorax sp. Seq25_V]|uniref:hypothetical protein n=1 Tax=Bacteriovorax sp. Seq25_V TaxID=1201288 RepID=UPI00054F3A86|nr:hypothetical protein [Bacteriovorax sp. Seq25_V]